MVIRLSIDWRRIKFISRLGFRPFMAPSWFECSTKVSLNFVTRQLLNPIHSVWMAAGRRFQLYSTKQVITFKLLNNRNGKYRLKLKLSFWAIFSVYIYHSNFQSFWRYFAILRTTEKSHRNTGQCICSVSVTDGENSMLKFEDFYDEKRFTQKYCSHSSTGHWQSRKVFYIF